MLQLKSIALICLSFVLISCSSGPSLEHHQNFEPTLDLKEYFTGPIQAWGIVQNRNGNIVRRFDINMVGTWEGDTGTLDEYFDYYDGEKERRIWTIKKIADNQYEGTAGDIIGVATGNSKGNTVRWAYQMDIDVGDNTFRLTFDDWMFLMNDGVLINRSYLKKFGVTVAELTLFMKKQDG
ncbi:MAG: DUF3833 domain-containing protein [Pseudomonadota bacterium]